MAMGVQWCSAGNPILRNTDPGFLYAADPAAEVFDGKVYVYCSHDQPDAVDYTSMQDYIVLESSDLKTWINHGVVFKPREFDWAYGQMNAPDAAYKDGWYYYYFPFYRWKIGVMKSRHPEGPWEPAVTTEITEVFDPTVFVDDDGQAYIYGNSLSHVDMPGITGRYIVGAKLKDNMIELDGPWIRLSQEGVSEGVTIFKRNGIYYFMARLGWSETAYWMADHPLPYPGNPDSPEPPVHNDPATGYPSYQGLITSNANNSVTAPSHMSAIEFQDQWYFFYHRGDVNDGNDTRRSACFDKMTFREDGTIEPIIFTLDEVPGPHGTMHQEAEGYADAAGVVVEATSDRGGGSQLGYINSGDWVAYSNLDFGADSSATIPFYARASSPLGGGEIELRLDRPDSAVVGTIAVPSTGTWTAYDTFQTMLTGVTGAHTLYLTFTGGTGYLLNLNWFAWTPPSEEPLAHWSFEEGSGSLVHDSTGHGFDGSLSGGTWELAPDGGYALGFDGTAAQVELPAYLFDSITNEVTIAMWVYGGAGQPRDDSLLAAEDGSGNRMLNIHLPLGDSQVYWEAGDGTGGGSGYDQIFRLASGNEVSGAWNHWVFIKDARAGTMDIYLNGTLWHSGTGKSLPVGSITQATIGSNIGSSYFDGMIDDVTVYNTALSGTRVAQLFRKPTSFFEDFSDHSAGPNMAAGVSGGAATLIGNFTAVGTTDAERIYLGTNDTDYSTVDFVFQALVTIPSGHSATSSPFIGMGSPDANADNYGQPTTGEHVLMLARPDANRFERYDNTVKLENGPAFNENGGTHLVQMTWNSTTKLATFNWDLGNDGGGAFDVTSTIDGSDNGFNSTNSQLFLGGGAGVSFDDISVTVGGGTRLEIVEIVHNSPTSVSITFTSQVGIDYVVSRSTDLIDWSDLTGNATGEAGPTTTYTDDEVPADAPHMFYRVSRP